MAATIRMPLARPCAILLSLLAASGLLGVSLSAAISGREAVIAALSAWFVVAATAAAALACGALAVRCVDADSRALVSVLAAMAVRMALPLAAAVVVKLRFPQLLDAGWLAYLIGYYLIALAIETWLALPSGSALVPEAPTKAA